MITTAHKQGYLNRHIDGLPKEKCLIKIITNDIEGEHILLCEWNPFNESDYIGKIKPNEGFLGTATVIDANSLVLVIMRGSKMTVSLFGIKLQIYKNL
jgi:hypothetical protein